MYLNNQFKLGPFTLKSANHSSESHPSIHSTVLWLYSKSLALTYTHLNLRMFYAMQKVSTTIVSAQHYIHIKVDFSIIPKQYLAQSYVVLRNVESKLYTTVVSAKGL